jgi:hypothetical protein
MFLRTALLSLLVAAPGAARAFTLAGDLNASWVTNSHVKDNGGFGAALRLGNDVGIPDLHLQIEVGGAITGFSSDHPAGMSTLTQVFGGARLGAGELIRPGIYGHVGYGWAGGNGLYAEGGIFLDLSLPIVSLGVHGAYQAFLTGTFREGTVVLTELKPQILVAGVHASLSF